MDQVRHEKHEEAVAYVMSHGYKADAAENVIKEHGVDFLLAARDKEKDKQSAEDPMPKLAPFYKVVSVVRHHTTRTLRAAAAEHFRRTQFVFKTQRRLIPARPITITGKELWENLEEAIKKEAQGILQIRTTDGRLVNLKTLVPGSAVPAPPARTPLNNLASADREPGEVFVAPGQPGYEEHAARHQPPDSEPPPPTESAPVMDVTALDKTPSETPIAIEQSRSAPTPGLPSEEELANAFDGPAPPAEAEEEPADDELRIQEEEQEHVDTSSNPSSKKKKNKKG